MPVPLFFRVTFAPETALCDGSSTRTRNEAESVCAKSVGASASKNNLDKCFTFIRLNAPSYTAASIPWLFDEKLRAFDPNRRRRRALCSADNMHTTRITLIAALPATSTAQTAVKLTALHIVSQYLSRHQLARQLLVSPGLRRQHQDAACAAYDLRVGEDVAIRMNDHPRAARLPRLCGASFAFTGMEAARHHLDDGGISPFRHGLHRQADFLQRLGLRPESGHADRQDSYFSPRGVMSVLRALMTTD